MQSAVRSSTRSADARNDICQYLLHVDAIYLCSGVSRQPSEQVGVIVCGR